MQTNATIERILDLSACYLGLRECGIEGAASAVQQATDATPEQGGSSDPMLHAGH